MKWLNFGVPLILWLPGFLATFNPYKYSLELLKQEPFSGSYTKNEEAFVEELWIDQKIDHFDEDNNQTWKMVRPYNSTNSFF